MIGESTEYRMVRSSDVVFEKPASFSHYPPQIRQNYPRSEFEPPKSKPPFVIIRIIIILTLALPNCDSCNDRVYQDSYVVHLYFLLCEEFLSLFLKRGRRMVNKCTTSFKMRKLCVMLKFCIFVFSIIHGINRDYLH